MKIFIGLLSAFIILSVSTLAILYIWGFEINWELIWKSGITLFIVCTALFFLWLAIRIFFAREPIPKEKGNKAHLIR